MAVSATLHCLTGCAVGEIVGLLSGTALGWGPGATIALSVALAFVFGFGLSTLPLLEAGLGLAPALKVVLAADTVSIAVMEVVDNLVVGLVPGAMGAGLVSVVFWASLLLALAAAFVAAFPVNRYLLSRGQGHALTHTYHAARPAFGARRWIPTFGTPALVAVILAFILGGLVVAAADDLATPARPDGGHAVASCATGCL
jgi:hypothetical protein